VQNPCNEKYFKKNVEFVTQKECSFLIRCDMAEEFCMFWKNVRSMRKWEWSIAVNVQKLVGTVRKFVQVLQMPKP
jgi:hypothetical protein